MNWKPIDSSPKDGTQIIAYDGDDMAVVVWGGPYFQWQLANAGSNCTDADFYGVTHWMPLPETPK